MRTRGGRARRARVDIRPAQRVARQMPVCRQGGHSRGGGGRVPHFGARRPRDSVAARRAGRGTACRAPTTPPWPDRIFHRFPFAVIALSGLTPLPFFPFKALAFATGYPIGKYAGAVASRSLPRYALLAWLGASVRLPVWLYVALFTLLLVPSLRIVLWPRSTRAAS